MRLIVAVMVLVSSAAALAEQPMDLRQVYYGGGLASNSVEHGAAKTALQLFAGYPLPAECNPQRCISVEVGYQDTSDTRADALWGAAVASWPVAPYVELVGRLGAAVGDYGSLLVGGGIGYELEKHMIVRAEFVARNGVNSLQFNLVYYPSRW